MRAPGRYAAGAGGARVGGVAGGGPDAGAALARPREFVSPFGHSAALWAPQVRHFPGHFARYVHGTCAQSEERLSPGENDPGLRREGLKEAAAELTADQAGLVAVGEPTIEKGVDNALTGAANVVKHTMDATTDEITSELQEALKS